MTADRDEPRGPAARGPAVAQYFGRLARTYGDGEYYSVRRAAVLRAIRAELARARHGLDLGCGNGRYLAEFRRLAPAAFFCGADFSQEMLCEARARAGGALIRTDASSLPFRDRAFDLIFGSHVLPFVPDIRAAVREIARCMVPGGTLVATAGGGGLRGALHDAIGEEQWRKVAPLFFGNREDADREGDELHREAFRDTGLEVEIRTAAFQISWEGLEEWVSLRWLPFATDAERDEAARIFSAIRLRRKPEALHLREGLLLGRRPPA